MASNMIHYAISKRIAEHISVDDEERFYFGAIIAPDASSHQDGSYDKAHFQGWTADRSQKGIDWSGFEQKYGNEIAKDSLYLGYWCHLVEDAMWFHDVVDRYVRIYSRDVRHLYFQKGYRDYQKLNYILKKELSLDVPFVSPLEVPIEEIRKDLVTANVNAFQLQFDADACEKAELELYGWNVIVNYMDNCVEFCVREIEAMKCGNGRVDPKIFYVAS